MQHLLNAMRFQSGIGQNGLTQARLGIITSYNPSDATVQVKVQPEDPQDPAGSLSGWVPFSTGFIGLNAAPRIGDQTILIFQEGNINCGMAIGVLYNDEDPPPPAPSGEWWLTHPSGSFIKIKNDGTIEIKATTVTIEGNLNVVGNISSTQNISDFKSSMEDMRNTYNSHTHTDPQGGNTGMPNQPM
jgi:hypothetical protein